MQNPSSPLRYPGGKASLSQLLAEVLALNGIEYPIVVEPYCGGAGAALTLLFQGHTPDVMLNDRDYRLYAFWKSARDRTTDFIQRIDEVSLNVKEWRRQKEIYRNHRRANQFDLGFATFYLNRCSRSGILTNAGPIGGYNQKGNYKIDARFPRKKLAERIRLIGLNAGRIQLFNQDALEFLKGSVAKAAKRRHVFVYLDPPYYHKGPVLYLNSYCHKDHVALSKYLGKRRLFNWVMSYDNCREIEGLYEDIRQIPFDLLYSAYERRIGSELLIAPNDLILPAHLNEYLKVA